MYVLDQTKRLEKGEEFLELLFSHESLSWDQRAPVKMGALTVAHTVTSAFLVPGFSRAWVTDNGGVGMHYSSSETPFNGIWTKYESSYRPVGTPFTQLLFGDHMPDKVLLYDANEHQVSLDLPLDETRTVIINVLEKMVNSCLSHQNPTS